MRTARSRSETEIYHVMARGNGKQEIFIDALDHQYFLKLLRERKADHGSALYAYCLMGNHYHLLIKESRLSEFCKRLNQTYAHYFNAKHETVGHVFQGRYKSFPVEDVEYLLCVLRYIHNNPVKARMVERPGEYHWSSCKDYLNGKGLADTAYILKRFDENPERALAYFRTFMAEDDGFDYETNRAQDLFLAWREMEQKRSVLSEGGRLTDADLKRLSEALHRQGMFSEREIIRLLGISKAKYYRKIAGGP